MEAKTWDLSSDDLVKGVEILERALTTAEVLAKFTTTTADDKAVAVAKAVLATIKPYLNDPLVKDLLAYFLTKTKA